jgi:hypothetical protein
MAKHEETSDDEHSVALHVRWGGGALNIPRPSQATVDYWCRKYAAIIVGALIALGSVAVGAHVAAHALESREKLVE